MSTTFDRSRPRSRAVATWLALVGGSFGLHRFYLRGSGDVLAWLCPWPTLAGALGFWRMREFGVDDRLGNLLVPLLGAMLAATTLSAIVIGLTSDARWAERYGAPAVATPKPGWPVVVAVVLALAVGATATLSTIAFTAQRYIESGR